MIAVQLLDGQVLERDATDEVDVAVGPEREARAVHRVVAPEQELVELERGARAATGRKYTS